MTHVVAICSDTHCGSTVGLCPPEGLELDEGRYIPSEAQKWLWECWESAWKQTKSIIRRKKFTLVVNGDVIDGDHHRTAQIASPLTGIHVRCAIRSLEVPLKLKPSAVHIMRGTPVHVGRSGETEEGIARVLNKQGVPIIRDPDTRNLSSYKRRIDIEGVRLDIAHHGRMGQRAHTRGSYSRLYAFDVWAEQALDMYKEMRQSPESLEEIFNRKRPADVAIRSHNHKYQDSGDDHRGITRIVSLPAFQLATEYVHRIAVESLADIGIVLLIIKKGEIEVRPIIFDVSRGRVLTS